MSTSVFVLVIAHKEDYFKQEGLNVELLSIRGEIALRTTLAGDVDFFTNAGSARRRGGSWRHRIKFSRCAARSSLPPSFQYADCGFRVAATIR